MLVTDQGKMIRTTVGDIRIAGRNTQGVTIFNVAENEKVVSVAKIDESEEEEVELEGGDEIAPETGATVGGRPGSPPDPRRTNDPSRGTRPYSTRPGRSGSNGRAASGGRWFGDEFKEETLMPLANRPRPGHRRPQDPVPSATKATKTRSTCAPRRTTSARIARTAR